jgi:hypothetical protein
MTRSAFATLSSLSVKQLYSARCWATAAASTLARLSPYLSRPRAGQQFLEVRRGQFAVGVRLRHVLVQVPAVDQREHVAGVDQVAFSHRERDEPTGDVEQGPRIPHPARLPGRAGRRVALSVDLQRFQQLLHACLPVRWPSPEN